MLVGDTGDLTPTLEKMYRAMGQELPTVKRILELNPTPRAGDRAAARARASGRTTTGLARHAPSCCYGMALLAEGGELADPARFARLVADRLARTL